MKFTDLFEELLAISLIDVEECKKNDEKMQYLRELILDFYEKSGHKVDDRMSQFNTWPIRERELIKFKIVKDPYLDTDQKMILYNNFAQDKIKSKSQFRRIIMMEKI